MEAENIRATIQNIIWALSEARIESYEILIIDCKRQDGTDDGTPAIAEELVRESGRIKVFHNSFINLGKKYWLGVDNAEFDHVVMVPGDNELTRDALRDILVHLGEADILISYPSNTKVRPLIRRVISLLFTFLVNFSTGLNLRYYNGVCVHRTDIIKQLKDRDDSFAYMAKLLVQLVGAGYSYRQIPIILQKRRGGKSAAFKKDNIVGVAKTLRGLFWDYRIRKCKQNYSKKIGGSHV
jgi:glycosyltransferase involved in cell wall biosynthesis